VWIKEVNNCLPENIRVLARYTLPSSAADFHAEMYCSQQVRTYVVLTAIKILIPSHSYV
jgi:tRNA U38,U39,U40 pseudouridine synthase TruA